MSYASLRMTLKGALHLKQTASWKDILKGGALGLSGAFGCYFALLALVSYFAVSGVVREGKTPVLIWVAVLLSALLGARLAFRRAGNTLAMALGGAALFWSMIQLLGFLRNGGLLVSRSIWMIPPAVLGGLLARVLRGGGHGGKRSGKRRQRGRSGRESRAVL